MLLRLKEIDPSTAAEFGAKAANLARLARLGFPVPEGFCIAGQAYLSHGAAPSIQACLHSVLAQGASLDSHEPSQHLRRLRREIEAAPLQPDLQQEIERAYRRLGGGLIAVRSSATNEDLPGHSFAGLYDTFLGIQGESNVFQAVKSCWASLWFERVFEYRERNGFDHRGASIGVIVQTLVQADASGVLFTSDPRDGASDRLIIEGTFGLGEALVSGKVNPDRIVLAKRDLRIIDWAVSEKKLQTVVQPAGGVQEETVPLASQSARCLNEQAVRQLGQLGLKVEKELGAPQDIEWAICSGKIFLLQARPITTLSRQKSFEDRQVWSNLNAGEVLPDVASPLTWSVVERLIYRVFGLILGKLGMEFGRHPLVGQIAGRAYFNLNTFTGMMRKIPGLGSLDPTEMFGGKQDEALAEGAAALAPEDIPDFNFQRGRFFVNLPGFLIWLLSHSTHRGLQFAEALRRNTERLEQADLSTLPDKVLIGQLHVLMEDPQVAMRAISYGGLGAMYLAPAFAFCRRWLGDADGSLANRLLGGLGNMDSAESGLDLWRLAAFAHEHPEVERTILDSRKFACVRVDLLSAAGGAEFLDRWEQFMARHGHHTRAELELMNPRWRETPDLVLDMVRSYVKSMGTVDPLVLHRERRRERRELNAAVRARLRTPVKRWLFQFLIEGAQRGCLVRENVKSEAVRRFARGRSIFLELGKRWQERGILNDREDIFFLQIDEIEPIEAGHPGFDVRGAVADRRAEYEKNKAIVPPAVVVGRFNRLSCPPEGFDSGSKILTGLAVSSGEATGPARVVLRSDTTEQVLPGEILVAPFTDPGWTPYFVRAKAIVMDMGGLLSHGSIIAREYGIPAVANVGPATRIIRTGQRLHVDGNKGEVRILD
jgi:pyruvate,water dikinase